jgi:hypothetical protein
MAAVDRQAMVGAEPDSDDEQALESVIQERKRKREMVAWARATGKKLNF